jgi:hypothetical protein
VTGRSGLPRYPLPRWLLAQLISGLAQFVGECRRRQRLDHHLKVARHADKPRGAALHGDAVEILELLLAIIDDLAPVELLGLSAFKASTWAA